MSDRIRTRAEVTKHDWKNESHFGLNFDPFYYTISTNWKTFKKFSHRIFYQCSMFIQCLPRRRKDHEWMHCTWKSRNHKNHRQLSFNQHWRNVQSIVKVSVWVSFNFFSRNLPAKNSQCWSFLAKKEEKDKKILNKFRDWSAEKFTFNNIKSSNVSSTNLSSMKDWRQIWEGLIARRWRTFAEFRIRSEQIKTQDSCKKVSRN